MSFGGDQNMLKQQSCKKCQKEMRFEFSIRDEIWNKLPTKWRDQVLCIECFLEELEKEVPSQQISLNDFFFLGIVGSIDNNGFGGCFLDSDYRKNKRIILGD
jgi:hypothetical protein